MKPANIKIKPDGTVKVLDFGLAKMGGTPTANADESPTLTLGQTEAGMILGTASYMSPEQAKGRPVDQRSDIYAFGAVLYEMVTREKLHRGGTKTEVLASVIREEPQLDKVPPQMRIAFGRIPKSRISQAARKAIHTAKGRSRRRKSVIKGYAESFRGADHLRYILEEAQAIISDALAASDPREKDARKGFYTKTPVPFNETRLLSHVPHTCRWLLLRATQLDL